MRSHWATSSMESKSPRSVGFVFVFDFTLTSGEKENWPLPFSSWSTCALPGRQRLRWGSDYYSDPISSRLIAARVRLGASHRQNVCAALVPGYDLGDVSRPGVERTG